MDQGHTFRGRRGSRPVARLLGNQIDVHRYQLQLWELASAGLDEIATQAGQSVDGVARRAKHSWDIVHVSLGERPRCQVKVSTNRGNGSEQFMADRRQDFAFLSLNPFSLVQLLALADCPRFGVARHLIQLQLVIFFELDPI